MLQKLKEFWYEEDGLGVVEIVIIIAVLVAIALLFRREITNFVKNLMEKVFDSGVADDLGNDIKNNKNSVAPVK